MDLASTIRDELAARCMSQKDLAQAVGMRRMLLSNRLNGHTDFWASEVQAIARVFGMAAWELVKRATPEEACDEA